MRHPDAIAFEKFLADNPNIRNSWTLGSESVNRFLENRLASAFNAGCDHVRRMAEGKFPEDQPARDAGEGE